jgi:hypothetical protein
MTIGFPAYDEETAKFRGVARKRLRRAVEDALEELRWHPRPDGKWRLRASVPNEFIGIFMTWGARLLIEIEEEEVFIRSEGTIAIAWLDIGQHRRNIKRFLDMLEELLDEEED